MNKYAVLVFLCFFVFGFLYSQGTGAAVGNTSAFTFTGTLNEPGQLQIITYIWGQVPRPGLYIVPDDTNVLTLISLAGGPTTDAKLKSIRIVRSSEFSEGEVIIVDLKQYTETGDMSLIPVLLPGDTVVVSGTAYYGFRRFVQFLSNVAVVFSVWFTISRL